MRFEKYEGLGNDFLVVDARDEGEVPPARAAELCDRRRGVGGDGVLLVLPPRTEGAAARMRVLNADGSVPEMCGNGIRCVAVHVARRMRRSRGELVIDTDAGPRVCTVEDGAGEGMVTVDMGPARVLGEGTIQVAGLPGPLTLVDVGNPHAVVFGSFTRDDVERIGPLVATHASFPRGTNVEFASCRPAGIDLVVWERGVGITLACGTGACATAAVACAKGLAKVGAPIEVRLPGGPLEVTIGIDGRATMRGPARRVFAGEA
jgi:diaminopimelate epimerase